jgi:putative ABC transport system substrate-binding protein
MIIWLQRRDFIALLGAAAAAWPLAVRAQQNGAIRLVGVLLGVAEGDGQSTAGLAAFTKALAELGWVDGRNIRIEYRWGASDLGRIQAAARELVGLNPDLLVGQTTPATAALQRETRTIPIMFVVVSDPVGSGFVASLPRPGGNITGFINIEGSVSGKWIEFLKDIVPGASRAALLYNPKTAPYFDFTGSPSRRQPGRAGSNRWQPPSVPPTTLSASLPASAIGAVRSSQ